MNHDNQYVIGSGFFYKPAGEVQAQWFFNTWLRNTLQYSNPAAIHVLGVGGCTLNPSQPMVNLIPIKGNLGHVHGLIGIEPPFKNHEICGWSASILILAMIAYNEEKDFIFKEQDCLWFGPCLDKMYEEIGDAGCIFGKLKVMPAAQSLFLVKHSFILEFCRLYLSCGKETHQNLPEAKYVRLMAAYPNKFKQFSFGYDRQRPVNFDDECFYLQKITDDEMAELKSRGMI